LHTSQGYFLFASISEQKVHLEVLNVSNFACTTSLQAQLVHLSLLELHDQMDRFPYISKLLGTILLPDLLNHHLSWAMLLELDPTEISELALHTTHIFKKTGIWFDYLLKTQHVLKCKFFSNLGTYRSFGKESTFPSRLNLFLH